MGAPSIARLKVTLDWVEPACMRQLEVPSNLRLDRLHQTLQAAFGWTDSHLWGFEAGNQSYGPPMTDFGFGGEASVNAAKATLQDALEDCGGEALVYVYDYGDNWEHVIEVEAVVEGEPDVRYPRLLAASGACPPEDVGGAPGYDEFLAAMADPDHERHEELTEWYGQDSFDAGDVDLEVITAQLKRLANRWTRRPPAKRAKAT